MKLTILGTGNAMVTKCYNTCFAIENDGHYFLVDGGGGNTIMKQLKNAKIPEPGKLVMEVKFTELLPQIIRDLLYLFWAITTGITAGAGMYVLAVLAAVIMIVMIYLFYHRQQSGKIYIVVIHYTGDNAGDEIIRNFGKIRYFIKSKTMRKEKTEMAVEVFCRQNQMDFTEKIRKIENLDDVTLIQYNGEHHG